MGAILFLSVVIVFAVLCAGIGQASGVSGFKFGLGVIVVLAFIVVGFVVYMMAVMRPDGGF